MPRGLLGSAASELWEVRVARLTGWAAVVLAGPAVAFPGLVRAS
jgi:hypothetical protein